MRTAVRASDVINAIKAKHEEESTRLRQQFFLGADPGMNGAIAVIDGMGTVWDVLDTPTVVIKRGRKKRRYLDTASFAGAIRGFLPQHPIILGMIEDVHAMPKQGVVTTFQFGRTLGALEGLLAGLNVPFMFVTPQRWKTNLLAGLSQGDKASSILQVRRLFPSSHTWVTKVKHDGRAEAILLAEYARRTHAGKL